MAARIRIIKHEASTAGSVVWASLDPEAAEKRRPAED